MISVYELHPDPGPATRDAIAALAASNGVAVEPAVERYEARWRLAGLAEGVDRTASLDEESRRITAGATRR